MNDYGMSLHVDLKRFIQNVYNNPNSPQWFSDIAINPSQTWL